MTTSASARSEKDGIYQDAVADTVKKFLPVYDNLERALHHETADEAYKKGVEMTLTELVKILDALGIKPFGEAGETFDPQRHNAVMHIEDESLGENVIAEAVFENATTDGVVRLPSAFAITTGSPPSITATQEFVVPRSIPIIFPIIQILPKK